jgi:hypothetical protein
VVLRDVEKQAPRAARWPLLFLLATSDPRFMQWTAKGCDGSLTPARMR